MVHELWHMKPSVFPGGKAKALLGAMSVPLQDLLILLDSQSDGKIMCSLLHHSKLATTKYHCPTINDDGISEYSKEMSF